MKSIKVQRNTPDRWVSKTLGDFLEKVEGGGTPSKENASFWNGNIPWASVKDVVTHNPHDTQDHISEDGLKNSSSRLVTKGTLIVPTRMALGHAVFFDVDVAINQDLKALYPKKEELDGKFLLYWFAYKRHFIKRLGSGSTVDGIQQSELKAIKMTLPPLPEQKRIVSVLETWDRAIEKLAKKIEIKKNIKKGLMQNLLTGKVRLSGFTNKWVVIRLGDIGSIITGNTPSMKEPENYGDFFCWATAEDFVSKYVYDTRLKLSEIGKSQSRVLPKGSLLITCIASIGKNAIAAVSLATNQQINSIVVDEDNNNEFIYYLLENSKSLLKRSAGAGAVPILNKSEFAKLKFRIPPSKREQSAIAKILTTADEEIETLQKKLALLKDQKKYLLNHLITGTIRTPESLLCTQ